MGRWLDRARAIWKHIDEHGLNLNDLLNLWKQLLDRVKAWPHLGRLLTAGLILTWAGSVMLLSLHSEGWPAWFIATGSSCVLSVLWEGQRFVGRRTAQLSCEEELKLAQEEARGAEYLARQMVTTNRELTLERDRLRRGVTHVQNKLDEAHAAISGARMAAFFNPDLV